MKILKEIAELGLTVETLGTSVGISGNSTDLMKSVLLLREAGFICDNTLLGIELPEEPSMIMISPMDKEPIGYLVLPKNEDALLDAGSLLWKAIWKTMARVKSCG